jgi:excisionase family DNA binding protein
MSVIRQADALAAAADALRLAADALAAAAHAADHDGREARVIPDEYMSMAEAGRRFGLSRSALHNAIGRGEIPSRKLGRRRVIPVSALDGRG